MSSTSEEDKANAEAIRENLGMPSPETKAHEIASRFDFANADGSRLRLIELIAAALRDVRREAIEEAAKVAENYDGNGLDSQGYEAQLGSGSETAFDITNQIRALAVPKEGS